MIDASFLKFLIALIVIMNPIGAIPVFLSMTGNQDASEKKRTAGIAATAVAITLVATALMGETLLEMFGIHVPAFRVAGGIIILLMAASMLHAMPSRMHHTPGEATRAEQSESVAIVPIAIPLLAGPGAISTVIVRSDDVSDIQGFLATTAAILFVSGLLWLAMRFAVPVGSFMGKTGANIATRLMGLILAAIAIEFIAAGLKDLFPLLNSASPS